MISFLFENTIQLTLLGMHQCSHVLFLTGVLQTQIHCGHTHALYKPLKSRAPHFVCTHSQNSVRNISTTDFQSYCSHNSCERFGHTSLHTNPLSLHLSWCWETFIQSSCLITQFLRSKNRQKGDQFFYQMSNCCENCNPHSSYHTNPLWWMFGWYSICRNM